MKCPICGKNEMVATGKVYRERDHEFIIWRCMSGKCEETQRYVPVAGPMRVEQRRASQLAQ